MLQYLQYIFYKEPAKKPAKQVILFITNAVCMIQSLINYYQHFMYTFKKMESLFILVYNIGFLFYFNFIFVYQQSIDFDFYIDGLYKSERLK